MVMTCVSTPWICTFFNLAFQLPGTIPVISDGREAIHIPWSPGGDGEVWERTPDGVTRHPTNGVTDARDVVWVLKQDD
jgi:hypothetical protein